MLHDWIQVLLESSWIDAVRMCYATSQDDNLKVMMVACKSGNLDQKNFAHYVHRLGAHIEATKTIIRAARKVEVLRKIDDVSYRGKPDFPLLERVELTGADLDPLKIIQGASLTPMEEARNVEAFRRRDVFSNFRKKMMDHQNLYWRDVVGHQLELPVRVHAELQLLYLFAAGRYRFVNDDRYIGCSKGACYFCYKYFETHHFKEEDGSTTRPVMPATHNTVIPGVCVAKANMFTDTMKRNLSSAIRQDILTSLNSDKEPFPFHPQSTDGPRSGPRSIFSSTNSTAALDSDAGYL
jgi:hypothetical protein